MASLYRSERRNPLLSLEQMLAEKTTLRTQKVTHRNIICMFCIVEICYVLELLQKLHSKILPDQYVYSYFSMNKFLLASRSKFALCSS
jgi:hypothetical protein